MAKRRVESEEITLEEILEEIKSCRIPTLTLDVKWQSLFDTIPKTSKLVKLEKKVNSALKDVGRINTKKAELKKLKKILMNEIVANMNPAENSKAEKKLIKSKELIEEINDKIILLEDEELDLPEKLRDANAELALESLNVIFDTYEDDEVAELEEWIKKTREELKRKMERLQSIKEERNKMNRYLLDYIDDDIIEDYKRYREQ